MKYHKLNRRPGNDRGHVTIINHTHFRLDIERKKEELRQLVGYVYTCTLTLFQLMFVLINAHPFFSERYRDMIESADSVISMKESTVNVSTCTFNAWLPW